MRDKGTAGTLKEESETSSAGGGCYGEEKAPAVATWGGLAGCAAPPVEREKSAAAVESM
jgi:hypothetical protein